MTVCWRRRWASLSQILLLDCLSLKMYWFVTCLFLVDQDLKMSLVPKNKSGDIHQAVVTLTGHSVDGSQGPEHSHSPNGWQAGVVTVQWVLHHPGGAEQTKHTSVSTSRIRQWRSNSNDLSVCRYFVRITSEAFERLGLMCLFWV